MRSLSIAEPPEPPRTQEELNERLLVFLDSWWRVDSWNGSGRNPQTPWTLAQPLIYTSYCAGLWGDIADADEWNATEGRIEKLFLENMDRQIGPYRIIQKRDRRRKSKWHWAVRKVEESQGRGENP